MKKLHELKTYKEYRQRLDSQLNDYLKYGVSVVDDRFTYPEDVDPTDLYILGRRQWKARNAGLYGGMAHKTARKVAQEIGMHFIYATRSNWGDLVGRVALSVPKSKASHVLVSALLLVAKDGAKTLDYRERKETPLIYYPQVRGYFFVFCGEEGLELFDNWLNQVKADKDFKRAIFTRKRGYREG